MVADANASLSTGEAAKICHVSRQTIIRCFDSGLLQGFRVPASRFRRILRSDLIRFMRENLHYGTVVHVVGNTLVTKGDSGQEHSHTLATDADVTCRGKSCNLSDLNAATRVRIAVQPNDEGVATVVECLRTPGTTLD